MGIAMSLLRATLVTFSTRKSKVRRCLCLLSTMQSTAFSMRRVITVGTFIVTIRTTFVKNITVFITHRTYFSDKPLRTNPLQTDR